MIELWKPVDGYPKYEVSNLGRVRSKFKILKWRPRKNGYWAVALSEGKRHTAKNKLVSRLVAAAFIGPCPPDKEVNHKDANKSNNADWNLEYIGHKENVRHASALGLCKGARGERNINAKLSADQARDIRKLRGEGLSLRRIAERFNVGTSCVYSVVRGETWAHAD